MKGPAREWPIPFMDHEPGDRPSAFSWAMGRLILQRMADRETIAEITADPRMPCYATVYRWTHVHDEFGDAYRQVRAVLARVRREERDARQALKPRRRSGKRSTYTPAWGARVCAAIQRGASLSEVVRTTGMPSAKAIYRWLRWEAEFRKAYMDACQIRNLMLAEQVREVALACTPATLTLSKRRVARLKGRAGRIEARLYRSESPPWVRA